MEMDLKEIQLNKLDSSTIKRLILFVENLEEKLSSVNKIHEKLNELVSIVSKTHENVFDELNLIKNILNQQTNQFNSKSLTDLNPDQQQQQRSSPLTQQSDRLSLSSASSCDSSSISNQSSSRNNSANTKKSSNLKKTDPSLNRPKSPKSVTFSFDQDKDDQNREQIPIQQQNPNQSTKVNSDLIPQLFEQHQKEITQKTNIGYKLGNALTNVRIHEIENENGDYLRLLNVSNSDDYDLSGHFLQQNLACIPMCRFKFPQNTILRAGQTVTIWCGSTRDIEPQAPYVFVWKEQRRWETGPECVTILAKPNGQAIAWARSSNRLNNDQSSGDILFVHSKINSIGSNQLTTNSYPNRSRLSAYDFIGNSKHPFTHSPSNSIHPDCNSTSNNDIRSQTHSRNSGGMSQYLTRPKSSPFSSHSGCTQDLISYNCLHRTKKGTIVKT